MTPPADTDTAAQVVQGLREKTTAPLEQHHYVLLGHYMRLLLGWSQNINLTGTPTAAGLTAQLLDVYSAWEVLGKLIHTIEAKQRGNGSKGGVRIADIGSGNGLPGIPFAILYPQHQFTLVESKEKRVRFLTECTRALPPPGGGMENVSVCHAPYQEIKEAGRYDIVLARALCRFDRRSTAGLRRLVARHGYLVAYKGKDAHLDGELSALRGQFSAVETNETIAVKPGRVLVYARA